MKWAKPASRKSREPIRQAAFSVKTSEDPAFSNFNLPLPDQTVAFTDEERTLYPADEDILAGRVKRYDSLDDMIDGLRKPW